MTRATSTIFLCLCLAACLPVLAQTTNPQPTSKFGLPTIAPAATPAPLAASAASTAPAPTVSASAPAAAQLSAVVNLGGVKSMFVTMTGLKQGTLGKGKVSVVKYQFQPTVSLDPNTGLPTGKRTNGPVIFSKQWDAASIPLLQALETNETLSTVTFDFMAPNNTDLFTVTLTNATVAAINQSLDSGASPLEEVHLTYQKITIQDSTRQVASATY